MREHYKNEHDELIMIEQMELVNEGLEQLISAVSVHSIVVYIERYYASNS